MQKALIGYEFSAEPRSLPIRASSGSLDTYVMNFLLCSLRPLQNHSLFLELGYVFPVVAEHINENRFGVLAVRGSHLASGDGVL